VRNYFSKENAAILLNVHLNVEVLLLVNMAQLAVGAAEVGEVAPVENLTMLSNCGLSRKLVAFTVFLNASSAATTAMPYGHVALLV